MWSSYWFNVVLCGTVELAEPYGSMVDLTPNRIHFRLDYILDRTGETFFPKDVGNILCMGPWVPPFSSRNALRGFGVHLGCSNPSPPFSIPLTCHLRPPPPGLTTTLNCRPREVLGSRYRAGGYMRKVILLAPGGKREEETNAATAKIFFRGSMGLAFHSFEFFAIMGMWDPGVRDAVPLLRLQE